VLDRVRILTVTIGKHKFRLLGATRKPCFMLDLKALIVVREVGRRAPTSSQRPTSDAA